MKNKKLFSTLASLLLVIAILTGCATTPESYDIWVPTDPTSSSSTSSSVPSSGTQASQPGTTVTPPSSTPATQPPASQAPETQPPATEPPATQPPTTLPSTTIPPATQPPIDNPSNLPEGSSLEVHFIDVGQADAILVICDGQTMLIDGGNRADSNLMYSYLQKHNITHLNYVIGTHAHEDHIGGIAGALQYATVDTVYCPTRSYSTQAFKNFVNSVNNRGASIQIPTIGLTFKVGSAVCTILAVNTSNEDLNNTSIVMRMVYGENSFLFTGDAEDVVEKKLLDSGVTLKSDVLKVGHHGSNSSTTYSFLREVMPEYAVICVGSDNTYGHPTSNTLSRLRDADVTTFRTDKQGDIICRSDGKTLTFAVDRNANANMYEKIGPNSLQRPTE